jgi:uncharacterized protein
MMEFLVVQNGLCVYAVNNVGHTLLMVAAARGHEPAAEWLLQQGVAVNAVDNHGYTALHRASAAAKGDHAAVVTLQLANGADVHYRCASRQRTALELAAYSGNMQCARVLISAGADVNHFDSMYMTSLHMAIREHHAAVAQLVLEHGATAVMNSILPIKCLTDAQCCTSVTALMLCTEPDTVKLY